MRRWWTKKSLFVGNKVWLLDSQMFLQEFDSCRVWCRHRWWRKDVLIQRHCLQLFAKQTTDDVLIEMKQCLCLGVYWRCAVSKRIWSLPLIRYPIVFLFFGRKKKTGITIIFWCLLFVSWSLVPSNGYLLLDRIPHQQVRLTCEYLQVHWSPWRGRETEMSASEFNAKDIRTEEKNGCRWRPFKLLHTIFCVCPLNASFSGSSLSAVSLLPFSFLLSLRPQPDVSQRSIFYWVNPSQV